MNTNEIIIYIDESEGNTNSKKLYLCAAIFFPEHISGIYTQLSESIDEVIADQSLDSKEKRKEYLHHCEDNDDIRGRFIDTLRMLQFKCYISTMPIKTSYAETYYNLLRSLLNVISKEYKDKTIKINYEQNSKIKIKDFIMVCSEFTTPKKKSKAPTLVIEEVHKQDSLTSIPDYILGAFITYENESNKTKKNHKVRRFERIRNKISLIIIYNEKTQYYNKKNIHLF